MRTVNEHDGLLHIAQSFAAEYDGLRTSRAISWYLRLRNKLSKNPYEPLALESDFPHNKAWMRLKAAENPLNREFVEHRAAYQARMAETNGSGYFAGAPRPRVGIVTDEFMFDYYENALDLTYLYPDTYKQAIDEGGLDLVLYVTCWIGRHESDEPYYGNDPQGHERIACVLRYAKDAGLPVVFQSIEDPPSYHEYLDLARMADVVFTSCEEKIPDYVRDLGHDRVFASLFGVNPLLNNPVGIGLRARLHSACLRSTVFFAGTWYNVHRQRCADTRTVFDAVLQAGKNLAIADRRWPIEGGDSFPEEYWHYLVPNMGHKDLQQATKLFDFAVNMNTVTDSRTMCAMRTYELQAAGVIGIANDALALKTQYPELVRIASPEDAERYFDKLTRTSMLEQQFAGIRRVMSHATVYQRLNVMFNQMGFDFCFQPRRVAIVTDRNDTDALGAARCQSVFDDGASDPTPLSTFAVMSLDSPEVAQCDFALILAGGDWPRTLAEDLRNAFLYTNCDYATATNAFDPQRFEYCEGPVLCAGTMFNLARVPWDSIARAHAAHEAVGERGFLVPFLHANRDQAKEA